MADTEQFKYLQYLGALVLILCAGSTALINSMPADENAASTSDTLMDPDCIHCRRDQMQQFEHGPNALKTAGEIGESAPLPLSKHEKLVGRMMLACIACSIINVSIGSVLGKSSLIRLSFETLALAVHICTASLIAGKWVSAGSKTCVRWLQSYMHCQGCKCKAEAKEVREISGDNKEGNDDVEEEWEVVESEKVIERPRKIIADQEMAEKVAMIIWCGIMFMGALSCSAWILLQLS